MSGSSAAAAKAALHAIPSSADDVNVLMGTRENDVVDVARLQITDDVAAEFRQIAMNAGWWDGSDYRLREYDAGYKPEDRDVVYAAIESVPGMAHLLELCKAPAGADVFDGSNTAVQRLGFYVIVGGTLKKRTYWIRAYSARRELTRGLRLAITHRKGAYDKLRSNVFTFDAQVDCIVHGSHVFIRNVAAFERIFNLLEAVRAQAQASVEHICSFVPVANAKAFVAACGRDARMAAKAVQIARRKYLESLTLDAIKRTVEKHKLPIVFQDGALVFEASPDKRWLLLQVLDDAYLDSIMTGLSYEVNSKAPL